MLDSGWPVIANTIIGFTAAMSVVVNSVENTPTNITIITTKIITNYLGGGALASIRSQLRPALRF